MYIPKNIFKTTILSINLNTTPLESISSHLYQVCEYLKTEQPSTLKQDLIDCANHLLEFNTDRLSKIKPITLSNLLTNLGRLTLYLNKETISPIINAILNQVDQNFYVEQLSLSVESSVFLLEQIEEKLTTKPKNSDNLIKVAKQFITLIQNQLSEAKSNTLSTLLTSLVSLNVYLDKKDLSTTIKAVLNQIDKSFKLHQLSLSVESSIFLLEQIKEELKTNPKNSVNLIDVVKQLITFIPNKLDRVKPDILSHLLTNLAPITRYLSEEDFLPTTSAVLNQAGQDFKLDKYSLSLESSVFLLNQIEQQIGKRSPNSLNLIQLAKNLITLIRSKVSEASPNTVASLLANIALLSPHLNSEEINPIINTLLNEIESVLRPADTKPFFADDLVLIFKALSKLPIKRETTNFGVIFSQLQKQAIEINACDELMKNKPLNHKPGLIQLLDALTSHPVSLWNFDTINLLTNSFANITAIIQQTTQNNQTVGINHENLLSLMESLRRVKEHFQSHRPTPETQSLLNESQECFTQCLPLPNINTMSFNTIMSIFNTASCFEKKNSNNCLDHFISQVTNLVNTEIKNQTLTATNTTLFFKCLEKWPKMIVKNDCSTSLENLANYLPAIINDFDANKLSSVFVSIYKLPLEVNSNLWANVLTQLKTHAKKDDMNFSASEANALLSLKLEDKYLKDKLNKTNGLRELQSKMKHSKQHKRPMNSGVVELTNNQSYSKPFKASSRFFQIKQPSTFSKKQKSLSSSTSSRNKSTR